MAKGVKRQQGFTAAEEQLLAVRDGFKNLDSAEQISLGGVNNIRGFPNSEASGTNGIITSLEHRFTSGFPETLLTGLLRSIPIIY